MKPKTASIRTPADTRQGDGRLSVTLLGLAMAAAAGVVFQLSIDYIDPHDTLARSVPSSAVFYLHVNADRLDDAAAGWLLPDNVRADEMAKFAVVNGTNGLSWGTLFAWRRGYRPTAAERAFLDKSGSLRLDDGTYLLTGDDNVRRLYAAERDWPSLAGEDGVSRSLTVVRGVTPVQGYLNPIVAPPQTMAGAAGLLKELEPLVFGSDAQPEGRFALAMPVRLAASMPRLIGFGVSGQETGEDELPMAMPATLRLTSPLPVFDPLSVLFGRVEKARAAFGPEDEGRADRAADALRSVLNDSSVVLTASGDGQEEDIRIAAEYPTVPPQKIIEAVAGYLGAVLPERTSLALPDGDAMTEFRLDSGRYRPVPVAGSEWLSALEIPQLDLKLYIRDTGRGGTILANDAGAAEELDTAKQAGNHLQKGRCATLNGRRITVDGPLIARLASLSGSARNPQLWDVSSLNFGLIIENSKDILIFCGYR